MYHFVRDLKHSRYPSIKGLDIRLFREQIGYLKKHYHFITMERLIDSIDNETSLPEKSVLLTFDDAYADHYDYVFPLLDEHGIQGSFFPPVRAIKEHTVLDVNKIHFILASESDTSKIVIEIRGELDKHRGHHELKSFDEYYDKLAQASRFDTAEVIFIKRLLQVELDEHLRKEITTTLFERTVGIDEASFSRELYMDVDQLRCLQRNGMHIGSHGYDHYWFGSLSRAGQKNEIEQSLAFLGEIGCDTEQWTMCYPYGNYDQTTIDLLSDYGCKLALTTQVDVADLKQHGRYTLPRLDTNDLPKTIEAATNEWYLKA